MYWGAVAERQSQKKQAISRKKTFFGRAGFERRFLAITFFILGRFRSPLDMFWSQQEYTFAESSNPIRSLVLVLAPKFKF